MLKRVFLLDELEPMAKRLFENERKIDRLDGWFFIKEIYESVMSELSDLPHVIKTAKALERCCEMLPIYIDQNSIFAGTQRDAFAKSYALINPNFRISSFNGYCDPTDVFNEIEANTQISTARIESVRERTKQSKYVKMLSEVYDAAESDTKEVCYFIEQVTGHIIPDFRFVLANGLEALRERIGKKLEDEKDSKKRDEFEAMLISLSALKILTERYRQCALEESKTADEHRKQQLLCIAETLNKVPEHGAETLYEAISSYLMLWELMCIEQAPNPFAFSVGNADRIFEPYRKKEGLDRDYAAGLFKHFLVFFNVGDRSWAISQNIIIGGKDSDGKDLTGVCSYALLDAYYAMNLPQPILSIKLHKNTPEELYKELGRFLFTPGCLTPSFFNDDSIFEILRSNGFAEEDLPDYCIAGCQEPLIMGKDNGNTTNSWLNLAKILELTLTGGISALSGERLGLSYAELGAQESGEYVLKNIRELFYRNLVYFTDKMIEYANGATEALSHLPVPFLSCFMGGAENGIDMRDVERQGTKYNGSGCLIHGLSVVADSFVAIDDLLEERPQDADRLIKAILNNFEEDEELRQYLLKSEKFGNNLKRPDDEASRLATEVSSYVASKKNKLGNSFRPDFSTPSTHLIYGSKVGALPNGRKAGEMLNYGIDPLYGDAQQGLGFRILSTKKLPFEKFSGGYASHMGLDPKYFTAPSLEEKGLEFRNKIIAPLFFSVSGSKLAPFYLYVNVTTAQTLRKVLANPQKYAPSGVYIMRIHGTFVNFLDLSPEIQEDIILRLDLNSTAC